MPFPASIGSKVALGIAIPVGVYAVILGALLSPQLGRFALYAHKFNTLFWHDINDPEEFGFAKNQVTPFNISTPDGETLYAWHILPLDVYTRNEQNLRNQNHHHGSVEDMSDTSVFHLLTSNDARVVVSFHGNAGHVAQGWRTDTYRYLTTQPNTHVLTVDYRGFGKSTGSPTEAGLITDGVALVNWVLHVANIPPERIVILGQSLGTAVAGAVGLHFADPSNELGLAGYRESSVLLDGKELSSPTTFAGIVLVAPFSSLPSLLLVYRIGGILPILAPLRPFPPLARLLTSQMVDKWPTAGRLAAYYTTLTDSQKLIGEGGRSMGGVQLIHAINDADISYHQTEIICRSMLGEGEKCIDGGEGAAVLDVKKDSKPKVRFEILEHGGHNRIVTYTPVAAAVVRAFEDLL